MVDTGDLKSPDLIVVRVRVPPPVHCKALMLYWDIYEVTSDAHSLHGVMLRGRIRKFALINEIDLLVENTKDIKNAVRFGVIAGKQIEKVKKYLETIFSDVSVKLIVKSVNNPVLSKLKVNQEERYTL